MIKLYCIVKNKTDILGLWKDEKGKIYFDNIEIKNLDYNHFSIEGNKLFLSGEKAIFYILDNKAYIEDEKGNRTILRHRITWKEKKIEASFIKLLLELHGGLTVFKNKNDYTLSIWKA